MRPTILLIALCLWVSSGLIGQLNIVSGEYFWDIDPGVGSGIAFSVGAPGTDLNFDFSPNTNGLANGNHILGFRVKKENGGWGETEIRIIHVHQFVQAEYFFDTDPGVGNATPAVLNSSSSLFSGSLTLNSAITKPGNHNLYVRTKGVGGKWGTAFQKRVWIEDYSNRGEYFWDTDPGVGNATAFTFDNTSSNYTGNVQFSSVGLQSGYHNLYVRMRAASGDWGHARRRTIWVADNIVGGEYFWDTDPGVGNGIPLPVYYQSDESIVCGNFNTNGLAPGVHYLYVRSKSAKNSWAHPARIEMTITNDTVVVGCPGDFDRNGSINTSDLLLLLSDFGSAGDCTFDLSGDFAVNTSDLLLFLAAFGSSCN